MRLVQAEILKLRKRRGLMIWASLLTVGSVVIALGIMVALHAASPDKHGPAGGLENLNNLMWVLSMLGGIAAVIVGTTAGSQDGSAGVFRDLAVTGRSRSTLFRVRTPGALAVFLPMLATGFAVSVAGSYAFAGSSASPTWHDVTRWAASIAAAGIVTVTVSVALGSIVPARIATGVLVGWKAAIAPILIGISFLGSARVGIDVAAWTHLAPKVEGNGPTIAMSTGTALIVLVAWAAVALRAGTWWTKRIDA